MLTLLALYNNKEGTTSTARMNQAMRLRIKSLLPREAIC